MRRNRSGMSRRNFLRNAGIGAAGLGAAAMGMSGVASAARISPVASDKLVVAIQSSDKPGFWGWNDAGGYNTYDGQIYASGVPVGIEADFARAVAVAMDGTKMPSGVYNKNTSAIAASIEDYGLIQWVGTTSTTRWHHLFGSTSPQVDVVFRSITNTMTRDMYQAGYHYGCTFMPTYYYDGVEILINAASPSWVRVAVGVGTTTQRVVENESSARSWNSPAIMVNSDEAFDAYYSGLACKRPTDDYDDDYEGPTLYIGCDTVPTSDPDPTRPGPWYLEVNATANDASALIPLVGETAYPNSYLHFQATIGKPFGNEPLSPAVREENNNWADIVRWVMYVLMHAEVEGFTRDNVSTSFGYDIGLANFMGLDPLWAYRAIKAVGNYGEIFYRWYGLTDGNRPGRNNTVNNGGLIYAPAFR